MSVLKLLLWPLAVIYDVVMNIRNRLYDLKLKPSVSFAIPIIGVGNLAVGGTGKTPMVEYIIRTLGGSFKLATLSRGYGRKTKGFRLATPDDTPKTLGDEPYQLFNKYGSSVVVAVGEDRAYAIPHLLDGRPDVQVIVLDDAFQHRRVTPGFSILLSEYSKPFYDDHVMPFGRLREGPEGANRADVIIITKCPESLSENDKMKIMYRVHAYSNKPVFFTTIRYGEPQPLLNYAKPFTKQVILLTGIAMPLPLKDYVVKNFTLVKHLEFRDHYFYTKTDLQTMAKLVSEFKEGQVSILTTEKDKVKLESDELKSLAESLPIFYLPIEMKFIGNGKDFDVLLHDFVNRG
ncbi:MAG: tetraacyldisaccharide 4'-kinase [Cyclobacteriaceae bacterium]|nr:tetraacyldisaccharide 4'-kinase [Cyclobacteriaceae bacterium]UYN85794.1 MAG: tetraacyldisaccharide 4'-kinase [Cyclobacteriaceae bacterium]